MRQRLPIKRWGQPRPHVRFCTARPCAAVMCLLSLMLTSADGVTQLKRGDMAPEIALNDLAGQSVTLAGLRGRVIVLLFGEPYHDRTRQACEQIASALRDPRLDELEVLSILVATHEPRAEDLVPGPKRWLPPTVLKDSDRKAFEAYRVVAMPSVVVVDKDGRAAHAVGGLTPQLGDVVVDAVLMTAGKLSPDKFEQALSGRMDTPGDEKTVRAQRLAQLAHQLARRGLDELAAEKYGEVLQLSPQHAEAHVGLGTLLLKGHRLPEAEQHFRATLAQTPRSQEAILGLAMVQIERGGEELTQAERTLREFLVRSPANARAHYLVGLIQEQQKKTGEAAASFKKAAKSLLESPRDAEEPNR